MMGMADELVAALAIVVFMAILVAWSFITSLWLSFTEQVGQPVGVPSELSFLVLLVAVGAGIVVYLFLARE